MKKILLLIIGVIMFVLGGCAASKEIDDYKKLDKMFDSMSSYSLTAEMTIYKTEKEIKAQVAVDYLKPNYYKVSFATSNGHEQIILKNTDGVFVLTPSLNKQFKFDSDWPLNSSNAYLIDSIWKEIEADTQMTYKIDGNCLIITASTNANDKFSKLNLYYNITNNSPSKIELLDNEGKTKVLVTIKSFVLNPQLSPSLFTSEAIMDNSNVGDGGTSESSASISVGYIFDDTTLQSKTSTADCTILCYGGAKNYTIVAKKLTMDDDISVSIFNSFDILDSGFVFYSNNVSKYFVDDLEISIYSKTLSLEEVCQILSEITTI